MLFLRWLTEEYALFCQTTLEPPVKVTALVTLDKLPPAHNYKDNEYLRVVECVRCRNQTFSYRNVSDLVSYTNARFSFCNWCQDIHPHVFAQHVSDRMLRYTVRERLHEALIPLDYEEACPLIDEFEGNVLTTLMNKYEVVWGGVSSGLITIKEARNWIDGKIDEHVANTI